MMWLARRYDHLAKVPRMADAIRWTGPEVRKPDWNTESGQRSMIIVTYGVRNRTLATIGARFAVTGEECTTARPAFLMSPMP